MSTTPTIQKDSPISIDFGAGEAVHVWVQRFEDDAIVVAPLGPAIPTGLVVRVAYFAEADARYVVRAEVDATTDSELVLRPLEDWTRIQEREEFRITTHGLVIDIRRRCPAGGNDDECRPELVDLSAGGLRFETRDSFDVGEEMACQFTLAEDEALAVHGRVVRIEPAPASASRVRVAIHFLGLSEEARTAIVGWGNQEQARRRREASEG